MGLREYVGGARAVPLTSPIDDNTSIIPCGSAANWPTGTTGPFSVIVGKGLVNEEKMLAIGIGDGFLTVSVRGYDDTAPAFHAPPEAIELVGTAIDLREANAHVNSDHDVHGLVGGDLVVGAKKPATLEGKTIDGTKNTLTNIPRTASPQLQDDIATLGASDAAQTAALADRYTKAETNAAIGVEADARTTADNDRYTKTEADARYVSRSGATMTGPLVLAGAPSGDLDAASKLYVDGLHNTDVGAIQTANAAIDALEGPPAVRIYQTPAAQSHVVDGVSTTVSFDQAGVLYDRGGFWSPTNPGRLTIPAGKGGLYRICAQLGFLGNPTGYRELQLQVNGALVAHIANSPSPAGVEWCEQIVTDFALVPTDYVALVCRQTSGNTLTTFDVWLSLARFSQ